ncbi:gibberellin 2-oxidase 8 [Actinidia rufa]|uniref:Gibberellin 2-oxidase 8 n=1 Tax=Actinidia rufa TaxID=165716 RepID=A0A7J0D8Q8_9ERIC|nr:gibberellin 2-oxidase 8 [Actinidia rufa]
MEEESPDPPFQHSYKRLFDEGGRKYENALVPIEERDLPVIDLSRLDDDDEGGVEREECKREIAMASREWGFFSGGEPRDISRDIGGDEAGAGEGVQEGVPGEGVGGAVGGELPVGDAVGHLPQPVVVV